LLTLNAVSGLLGFSCWYIVFLLCSLLLLLLLLLLLMLLLLLYQHEHFWALE